MKEQDIERVNVLFEKLLSYLESNYNKLPVDEATKAVLWLVDYKNHFQGAVEQDAEIDKLLRKIQKQLDI